MSTTFDGQGWTQKEDGQFYDKKGGLVPQEQVAAVLGAGYGGPDGGRLAGDKPTSPDPVEARELIASGAITNIDGLAQRYGLAQEKARTLWDSIADGREPDSEISAEEAVVGDVKGTSALPSGASTREELDVENSLGSTPTELTADDFSRAPEPVMVGAPAPVPATAQPTAQAPRPAERPVSRPAPRPAAVPKFGPGATTDGASPFSPAAGRNVPSKARESIVSGRDVRSATTVAQMVSDSSKNTGK